MKMRSDKRELDKVFKRRDRYDIPNWQRDKVWNVARKQKLIDSILRGWRLPKFYLVATDETNFDVVDGQQRLTAIFEFLSGELELSLATAQEFGGKTYKELPMEISDRIDDFEIDFDEISDATESELRDFFQRLQSGVQLNSSEILNSMPSNLTTFCRKMAGHKFFTEIVSFSNVRFAHFDVMAKVATLEVEGIGARLRLQDVRQVFTAQSNFSEQSQVAKRVTSALDYLAAAIPTGAKILRTRSITQSFITMICHLQKSDELSGKEVNIKGFVEYFVKGLAEEVEKGQAATDLDYIAFQKSVNANVKSGPAVRNTVLLRKLFKFYPDIIDIVDPDVAAKADFSSGIGVIAKKIRDKIAVINDINSSQLGEDLFKATNKTTTAQGALGDVINSVQTYKSLIEHLYFLLWEGPGSKISDKPASFKEINTLRTELQHDTDHGDKGSVKKKKIKYGQVFKKYTGVTSPLIASPNRFPLLQIELLTAVFCDLEQIHLKLAQQVPTTS